MTLKNQNKNANSGSTGRINTRKYFWFIIGYYVFTVYIRSSNGAPDMSPSSHLDSIPAPLSIPDPPELGSGSSTPHGDEGGHHGSEHGIQIAKVDFSNVETPFIIALWIFCASLAKIVFHMAPKLSHIFPESCLLIFVGVAIGLILFHTNSVHVSPLTPSTFFFYMLPPIILDAGYFMPNRLFFNNLGTILLFAVIGTLWNTFSIGLSLYGLSEAGVFGIELNILQIFLFSALVSAVDPVAVLAVFEEIHVNEVLYIVVFGESLLNDAVTVVLYHMFEEYTVMGEENVTPVEVLKGVASFPVVALGGTAIGIIYGFLTGFVTRFTNQVRVIEPIFIFVMAYLAYLSAETFHMSGILATTFCGITMKNYVEANISYKSHTTVKYAMKMLSSSSETIIFMFLGVSTIHDEHHWNWAFISATILFCTVYRTIGTIVLSYLANHFRLHRLGAVDQFVMSYGGLRGAVAFALVLLIPEQAATKEVKNMFTTTTICVVYFTVFLQGITIKPLVQWLKVSRAEKRKHTMNERIHERLFDHTMSVIESLLGTYGHYNLRDRFKHFDNTYIRPCLIRDHKGHEPKILETFTKLTLQDAMDVMAKNRAGGSVGTGLNKLASADSMAHLIRNQQFEDTTTASLATSSGTYQPPPDSWNLDLQELEYSLSKKDMSDAKIHHILAEELYKPSRRQRRLSYSRHAVDDTDLGEPQPMVNYRTPMNPKKMLTRGKRGPIRFGTRDANGHVTFSGSDNPAFSMDERLQGSPDGDGGIYFIAGNRVSPSRKPSTREETSTTPVESTLPWKRGEEGEENTGVRQDEFPAWSSNKEYLAYHSPTNTYLGGLDRHQAPSVIGLFKRDSVSSANGSRRGSVQSLQHGRSFDSPRHSVSSITSHDLENPMFQHPPGPSAPTLLARRGSTFGISIPEEVIEETDKDLIEIESKKSSSIASEGEGDKESKHEVSIPVEDKEEKAEEEAEKSSKDDDNHEDEDKENQTENSRTDKDGATTKL